MTKFWKIKNISPGQTKFAVAISSNGSPGIVLKPGQFTIGVAMLTSSLDQQIKRKFITVEDFDNSIGLALAKAYNQSELDKVVGAVETYVK